MYKIIAANKDLQVVQGHTKLFTTGELYNASLYQQKATILDR